MIHDLVQGTPRKAGNHRVAALPLIGLAALYPLYFGTRLLSYSIACISGGWHPSKSV